MKTTLRNIHSVEDIQKLKLRLEQKMRATEKSISEKTDIVKLLFNTREHIGRLSDEEENKLGIVGYLLPLGINYVIRHIQKKPDKKLFKRLLIYTALGSVSAFFVYKYIEKQNSNIEK